MSERGYLNPHVEDEWLDDEDVTDTDVDVPNPWAIVPPGSEGWRTHTWEWALPDRHSLPDPWGEAVADDA